MKFLSLFIIFISASALSYSQTRKYKIDLPQRDSVAVRPYKFTGIYKSGTLNWSLEFEKDKSEKIIYNSANNSTSLYETIKPNGVRVVQFQFQFINLTSKILLDTTVAYEVDLRDGHAIEPATAIIRFKKEFSEEPYKAKLVWFYYDYFDLKDKTRKIQINPRTYFIDLYKNN
jgi:hypothetical protein